MNSLSKAVAVVVILAAGAQAKLMEDTVAVVNGAPILLSEFSKEFDAAREYWSRNFPGSMSDIVRLKELREKTLEELINHELLHQEGVKLKVRVRERDIDDGAAEIKGRFAKDEAGNAIPVAKVEENFKKELQKEGINEEQFRKRLTKQIMARKVIDQEVRGKMKPPEDEEAKAYFDKAKKWLVSGATEPPKGMDDDQASAFMEFAMRLKGMTSERVRVSQILIKFSPAASEREIKRAKETTLAVKKKLDGGADFMETAKTESEDPGSASQGGDIGYVVRGIAPKEIEDAAFSLPVGEISEPIKSPFGWHLLRVSEKRAAETPEFDKFKEQVGQFLGLVNTTKEIEKYVKALKAKAVIERNLPEPVAARRSSSEKAEKQ